MEKNVKVSILCQIYGKLLTKKQYEIITDYYDNDLSLSEIAENNKITRQAVRDIIKKSEKNQFTGIVRDVILQCRSFCAENCKTKVSVDKNLSFQPVLWGRENKK